MNANQIHSRNTASRFFSKMMKVTLLSACLPLLLACGAMDDDMVIDDAQNLGHISLRLDAGKNSGAVAGILYEIFGEDGSLLKSRYVPMQEGSLPSSLVPNGEEINSFADAFFVLPPGAYLIRVTPMKSETEPDSSCTPVEQEVTVVEGETTEIALNSTCNGQENGGLDIVGVLNHKPQITDLTFNPSKFISTCKKLVVKVEANDPDGDELTYKWEIVEVPPSYQFWFSYQDGTFNFISSKPGEYKAKVTVCEKKTNGACASLTFPIHVQLPSSTSHKCK